MTQRQSAESAVRKVGRKRADADREWERRRRMAMKAVEKRGQEREARLRMVHWSPE